MAMALLTQHSATGRDTHRGKKASSWDQDSEQLVGSFLSARFGAAWPEGLVLAPPCGPLPRAGRHGECPQHY